MLLEINLHESQEQGREHCACGKTLDVEVAMTIHEVIQDLKQNREKRAEIWQFPIILSENDSIAAELIEVALQRLGEGATTGQLLDVAGSFMWFVQTFIALHDNPTKIGIVKSPEQSQ
jgi:hypothetical protein